MPILPSGSKYQVLTKKQRDRKEPDFDNVQDEISHRDLQGLSDYERARRIVAWTNWWFRSQKFLPQDLEFRKVWLEALEDASSNVRNGQGGQCLPLFDDQKEALQRIKQSLVPVTTQPFADEGSQYPNRLPHVDHFLRGYDHYRKQWLDSDQYHGLEKVLRNARIPFVNKIVGFGIGSPLWSADTIMADLNPELIGPDVDIRYFHRHRFTQYAIIMRMADFFENQHGQHVQVYIQDPDLRETDEEALEQLGCTILDGEYDYQEGFVMIDDNTLVYDAITCIDIFQIYMEYAVPAAVMTTQLGIIDYRYKFPEEAKFVIIQDARIENNLPIPLSQPRYPGKPTKNAFNILKSKYNEVLLFDEGILDEDRRRSHMTGGDIHWEAEEQFEQKLRDYYETIQAEIDAEENRAREAGTYNDDDHNSWAVEYTKVTEYVDPPPDLGHKNFSEQKQLALYVRKQGILPNSPQKYRKRLH
ncbi:hypothetical protein VP1G_02278 [Cytospora mali]|uniref:SRR1-like domain-containing protein n=1 Tax=Cytospora mali TaxID=578113 RepID=A0A194UTB6_CYTMA|nr:hypothetical protein VP1G_02278 [Valsa mali var. pyri (nom. inval.)]